MPEITQPIRRLELEFIPSNITGYDSIIKINIKSRVVAGIIIGIRNKNKLNFAKLIAFFKSILFIGILDSNRFYYWHLLFWSLFKRRELFTMAITYSIYGYHYKKSYDKIFWNIRNILIIQDCNYHWNWFNSYFIWNYFSSSFFVYIVCFCNNFKISFRKRNFHFFPVPIKN